MYLCLMPLFYLQFQYNIHCLKPRSIRWILIWQAISVILWKKPSKYLMGSIYFLLQLLFYTRIIGLHSIFHLNYTFIFWYKYCKTVLYPGIFIKTIQFLKVYTYLHIIFQQSYVIFLQFLHSCRGFIVIWLICLYNVILCCIIFVISMIIIL